MNLYFLVLCLSFMAFAARRLLTLLHPYQQEEYDSPRFLRWIGKNRVFDRKLSALLLLIGLLALYDPRFALLAVPAFGWIAWKESDPRQKAKKKLVMTARAKRIYGAAFGLTVLFVLPAAAGLSPGLSTGLSIGLPTGFSPTPPLSPLLLPFFWIAPIQLMPLFLCLGNALLSPLERREQARYRAEAERKLGEIKPFVIGITGSYGKTSVKHILAHILSTAAPTLATPGSVNTPMGVTRIIREDLTPRHKYFIVEMGAYGPGSIARLCALTPPDMAIVTAIGPAHYERFKSLETVARTKFELPLAVFAKGDKGLAVIHESTLAHDAATEIFAAQPQRFVVCGDKGADTALKIKNVTQTAAGLVVEIHWKDVEYRLEAPLYGQHHGSNMALAFAAACTVGIAPQTAIAALKTTPQIAHRLEVKPWRTSGLLIDDAYNSNPKGFESALELLNHFGTERKARRILVTPGMVELGTAHDDEHTRIGLRAAQCADIVLAVAPARIQGFVKAFRDRADQDMAGQGKTLIELPDFTAAERWLAANGRENDIVLLENDLPDLFESPLRL